MPLGERPDRQTWFMPGGIAPWTGDPKDFRPRNDFEASMARAVQLGMATVPAGATMRLTPYQAPPYRATPVTLIERFVMLTSGANAGADTAGTNMATAMSLDMNGTENDITAVNPTSLGGWVDVVTYTVPVGFWAVFNSIGMTEHDGLANVGLRVVSSGKISFSTNDLGSDLGNSSIDNPRPCFILAQESKSVVVQARNLMSTAAASAIFCQFSMQGWKWPVIVQDESEESMHLRGNIASNVGGGW